MGDSSAGEDLGLGLGLGRLGQQLQGSNGRLNSKEEGSWRRHMSLELEPLVPASLSRCPGPIQADRGLGKSMSVQDLMQAAAPGTICEPHHSHSLSSPSPSTSSGSPTGFHSCQDPGGGRGGGGGGKVRGEGGGWGEDDLFISDRDIDAQRFDFLSQGATEAHPYSSDLLRTEVRAGTGSRGSNHSLASGHASSPSTGSSELLNMPHVRLK